MIAFKRQNYFLIVGMCLGIALLSARPEKTFAQSVQLAQVEPPTQPVETPEEQEARKQREAIYRNALSLGMIVFGFLFVWLAIRYGRGQKPKRDSED